MRKPLLVAAVCLVLALLGLVGFILKSQTTSQSLTISGMVVDATGPVPGAIVQVQTMPNQTRTTKDGAFTVLGVNATKPVTVTAWADGYYVGWATLDPGAPDLTGSSSVKITLQPLYQDDNHKYTWFSFNGVKGSESCGLCHREYKEWKADAHSQSASNPRFISLYRGTDVQGHESPLTQLGTKGKVLPPDPEQPYYGPGYRIDNPNRAGNCATCHTPLAAKVPNNSNCTWSGCHMDLTAERAVGVLQAAPIPLYLSGDAAEGITCDFCHKIGAVNIDLQSKLPHADMPGILSMRLYRPQGDQQLFFGTMVDQTRKVSYLPLESKSEFCGACHYGVFGGVMGHGQVSGGNVIYNSYGEWLKSPYSDPKSGITCQGCHMPPAKTNISVFAEQGGIQRDYVTLHNHQMPGASDEKLLKNAVTLKSTAQHDSDKLQVEVNITNDKAGHDVPTDVPLRQMILLVKALDAAGKPLALIQGPVNPTWAGDLSGQPGKTFAKLLRDDQTGEMPTAAFWRPITIVEDNRIVAMTTDTTRYSFNLPAGAAAKVEVHLIYRRAPQELEKQKGWTDPDIVMNEATIQIEK